MWTIINYFFGNSEVRSEDNRMQESKEDEAATIARLKEIIEAKDEELLQEKRKYCMTEEMLEKNGKL